MDERERITDPARVWRACGVSVAGMVVLSVLFAVVLGLVRG
ncbi:hypothetical protein ACIQ9P_32695 [Kitasatospora sp. NPDC094019]